MVAIVSAEEHAAMRRHVREIEEEISQLQGRLKWMEDVSAADV